MKITFKTVKLRKIFNSEKELLKKCGSGNRKKIKLRMTVLKAASNLSHGPEGKPDRCHELKGTKKGQFAVDLKHPFRLIFYPDHDPLPLTHIGDLDLTRVTCIKILSVEDYH